MFNCQKIFNALGQMQVRIDTTKEDWDRLLETGLWDEVVEILANEPKELEEQEQVLKEVIRCHEKYRNGIRIIMITSAIMAVVNLIYLIYQISVLLK